jgi:hypothetical protein
MKQFILVGGMDYELTGADFDVLCQNRMKRIILSNKKQEELTFQIFDVRHGTIAKNVVTYPKGKKVETKSSSTSFDSVSAANYVSPVKAGQENHFKNGQVANIMSITDVYQAVRDIGASATDKNTLMELSFFSHGWMGGPILVNSFDDRSTTDPPGSPPDLAGLTVRDPDDRDARAALDFISPTMDAAALTDFQNAFHTDGFIWIWGCSFPKLVHTVLTKIERNKNYKSSGVSDETVFTFNNFETDEINQLLKPILVPTLPATTFANKSKIELKFKFIKFLMCRLNMSTYAFIIALNSKVKTYAAPLGTYSDYETGVKLPLMVVYPGFISHFNFYKTYLGFSFDPEGRKYGEYLPTFTCTTPTVP